MNHNEGLEFSIDQWISDVQKALGREQDRQKLEQETKTAKRTKRMNSKRYYYQWTDTSSLPWVDPREGWQIFDRELTTKSGEALAIALCVEKAHASRIASCLNEMDRLKKKIDRAQAQTIRQLELED